MRSSRTSSCRRTARHGSLSWTRAQFVRARRCPELTLGGWGDVVTPSKRKHGAPNFALPRHWRYATAADVSRSRPVLILAGQKNDARVVSVSSRRFHYRKLGSSLKQSTRSQHRSVRIGLSTSSCFRWKILVMLANPLGIPYLRLSPARCAAWWRCLFRFLCCISAP